MSAYYQPALLKILKYLLKSLQIADLLACPSSAEDHFEGRSSRAVGVFRIKRHFIRRIAYVCRNAVWKVIDLANRAVSQFLIRFLRSERTLAGKIDSVYRASFC